MELPFVSRARVARSRRGVLLGLVACGTASACARRLPQGDRRGRAALLLPLTGPNAALGSDLQSAAGIGGVTLGLDAEIEVLDAGQTGETAVAAARAGLAAGAQIIVGPVFAPQARAVAEAVPRSVPVVALTNDETVARSGAFVYGVTPRHSARAAFTVAASRGLTDIAVIVPADAFGEQSAQAARSVAGTLQTTLRPTLTAPSAAELSVLQTNPPDAVYIPAASSELVQYAAALGGRTQIIGSAQWSALDTDTLAGLEGAWFAAPDPVRFQPFAQTAVENSGRAPGIISGLVFDAVEMARVLGRLGQQTRAGVTRSDGFAGVLGRYQVLENGLTERALSVLSIGTGGAVSAVGTSPI